MTPDRKHPTPAFWITVALVAVLVGYPLSFGPACWLADRGRVPNSIIYGPLWDAYQPLAVFLANFTSNRPYDAMIAFGHWGSGSPQFPTAESVLGKERALTNLRRMSRR